MYVRTEVRPSQIFGRGLFALEPIARGTIICFFPIGAQVITEERFLQAVRDDEHMIVRTGTRYAGRYYTVGNASEPYTFLNHSFAPNLLCHCGTILARRDLPAGEELTLDYRTLVDATDLGTYRDAASGQEIRGYTAKETLLRTARELIEIIEPVERWEG